MLAEGRSFGDIAAELGLARNTVRRFARSASPDELLVNDRTGRRPSILDKHAPYLRERWNCGCTSAALLGQEIRARGYPAAAGRSAALSRVSAETPPSRSRRRSGLLRSGPRPWPHWQLGWR
jgi:transposase